MNHTCAEVLKARAQLDLAKRLLLDSPFKSLDKILDMILDDLDMHSDYNMHVSARYAKLVLELTQQYVKCLEAALANKQQK